ncbi:MAG: benzylsuccinate CoA-transferase BbsF subunit [Gammaproteobacteria bacterium]|jgi:benzylsuccinate CoA-transferase BbsF subunit
MLADCLVLDCTDQTGWLTGRVLADLGAEVIKIESPASPRDDSGWQAFNVNKQLCLMDLVKEEGQKLFDKFVTHADIILVCTQPGKDNSDIFEYQRLAKLNPNLILVRITPYGTDGPRAHWRASDLELMAAGGAMSLAGEPDSTPVRISVPQSYAWTGVQAAVGALTALNARRLINRGQEVRVSAQASVLPTLAFAPMYWDMLGTVPTRAGSFAVGRSITGAKFRAFWPCKDGYLNFIIYGGAAGRRTNRQLVKWMQECNCDLGVLSEIDWDSFTQVKATQEEIDAMEEPIARFFLKLTKNEFLEQASKRELLGYPVFTVDDISEDPQLKERNFWSDNTDHENKTHLHCGVFYLLDGERPALRYSNVRPKDADLILQEIIDKSVTRDTPTIRALDSTPIAQRALEGVKVLEFGGYAAGPQIGKILANFGATVIHVESPDRPDGFRLEYPPFKDGKPGLNRGGCFSIFNDSKYAITLDVKKPGGIDLALRLTEWADVVIENMRPGVINRIGLGFEALVKNNSDLVMLSTCNMGQTGSRAMTPGFGSQLSALSGFCGLTGATDGPPMLLYGPYIDFIAANFGAAAVLAALDKSKKTGQSSKIDLSQYETGLQFIAGALYDYHEQGIIAARDMNSDPLAVPHGAYPCLNNQWLTLSCWSDDEFKVLTMLMGKQDLALDPRFSNLVLRKKNEKVLNDLIGTWSLEHEAVALAETLQNNGICSYPVNTVAGVFSDPQLSQLEIWRWQQHPEIGRQAYIFPPFDLCETPGDIYRHAPLFGGDNDYVFRELVGLGDEEMENYRQQGVIG